MTGSNKKDTKKMDWHMIQQRGGLSIKLFFYIGGEAYDIDCH